MTKGYIVIAWIWNKKGRANIWINDSIGRTVPLLKPPQSPPCYLGTVDHTKNSPPPTPGHTASPVLSRWSYRDSRTTQTLLFSSSFDLAQVCHRNKICWKHALTWKLTLELVFPAHCILNWKLNGISRTNISKVTLNAANERARCSQTPPLGQEVG